MITREAMTVMCTMMRMLVGMWRRIRLMAPLENTRTKITARHMVADVSSLLVTARAEQIPTTCREMGFSSKMGASRVSRALPMVQASPSSRSRSRKGP